MKLLQGGKALARVPRQFSKTGFYHVMMRGINREWIFEGVEAKEEMLNILEEKVADSHVAIYAYCIMDNHIHLVLKAEPDDLVTFMKKVNGSYALNYNWRKNREGPVFHGRYKSECVEDEQYFWGVLRYLHLNPVHAHMVKAAQEYKWSSLNDYLLGKSRLLDESAFQLKRENFSDNKSFLKMHEEEDLNVYLDVEEDLVKIKGSVARRLIHKAIAGSKVPNVLELRQKEDVLQNLLRKLALEVKLTYKEIAELTNLSYSMVQRMVSKSCDGV